MNINDLSITGVSADEQETTINFSRTDKEAEVYTSDNTVLTKIKNMFSNDDCEWKLKDVVLFRSEEIDFIKSKDSKIEPYR